ncbi:MAG: hypothetical protein EVA89_06345 [Sandaracinaceae bacterium]|nr:MAG: hypothetical protein EVA89_06345 [Sandaracinaceae bacterium]
MGQPWGTEPVIGSTAVSVARAVIAVAQSADAIPHELATALADSVLEAKLVRLALEVREGSPQAARRAIELATLILDTTASHAAEELA